MVHDNIRALWFVFHRIRICSHFFYCARTTQSKMHLSYCFHDLFTTHLHLGNPAGYSWQPLTVAPLIEFFFFVIAWNIKCMRHPNKHWINRRGQFRSPGAPSSVDSIFWPAQIVLFIQCSDFRTLCSSWNKLRSFRLCMRLCRRNWPRKIESLRRVCVCLLFVRLYVDLYSFQF